MKIKNVTRFLEEEELIEEKLRVKMKQKPKKMKSEEFHSEGKKPLDKKKWKYREQ